MVKIIQHALRHGLTERALIYAWNSPIRCRQRNGTDDPPIWIAIGMLPDGRLVELVAFQDKAGYWNVFHAMTPPTKKFIKELGLKGESNGRH